MDQRDDELITACRVLIAEVNVALEKWRFEPSSANEPAAAAGLCRATDLLSEALDLAVTPGAVGANVLVRTAFEFWLFGTWVLFGGVEAVLAIESNRVAREHILARENELGDAVVSHILGQKDDVATAKANLLGDDVELSAVVLEQIATKVTALLKAHTDEPEDATVAYKVIYRSLSTNDAHPAVVLGQLIAENPDGTASIVRRPLWQNPVVATSIMLMYIGRLAFWIDRTQSGQGDWSARVDKIQALLDGQH